MARRILHAFQLGHCVVVVRDVGTGQPCVLLRFCIGIMDSKRHILEATLIVHELHCQNFRADLCAFSPATRRMLL